MSLPASVLLATLRQGEMLTPEQTFEAQSLAASLLSTEALAKALVGRGWLTPYQADELCAGRGAALVVGSYVLLEPLGKGGMGDVFRARHKAMNRVVALKRLKEDMLSSSHLVERFQREVRATALLSHPNVVQVYDGGTAANGLPFLAMELLDGVNLADYLARKGLLSVAEAVDYVRQACLGMQHAHEKGLVHRDLKPANLMLCGKRQIKILDLGLALVANASMMTQAGGGFFGTVDYVAPEQVTDSHHVDVRADVYSLGCTLYHLLTGRTPYGHAPLAVRPFMHGREDPPPIEKLRPEVPPELADVLRKMMARKPEQRYQTPGEAAVALAALLGDAGDVGSISVSGSGSTAPPSILRRPTEIPGLETKTRPGGTALPRTEITRQGRGASKGMVLAALIGVGMLLILGGVSALLVTQWSGDGEKPSDKDVAAKDKDVNPKDSNSKDEKPKDEKPKDVGGTTPEQLAYEAAMRRAQAAFAREEFDEALDHYRDALARKPDDAEALEGTRKAQEGLKSAADSKRKDAEYRQAMKKARAASKDEHYADAIKHFESALAQKPNDKAALDGKKEAEAGLKRPITNSVGMTLVRIPAGKFMMGSTEEEREAVRKAMKLDEQPDWLKAEGPRHEVTLTKDFYLGVHEVTQKQYKEVMGHNPSYFSKEGKKNKGVYLVDPAGGKDEVKDLDNTDDFPVENVSWEDAQEFLKKLNDLEAETAKGRSYRLPTEAEWEYACRGGLDVKEPFTFEKPSDSISSALANFNGEHPFGGGDKGTYLRRTTKVGSHKPNAFGLCDMHGNVWEWCADTYDPEAYKVKDRKDPLDSKEDNHRVLRGGSWDHVGQLCRSAYRDSSVPSNRYYLYGFRVVCVVSRD